jgi:Tol biopolymer transport system component
MTGHTAFSVSENGVLAYRSGNIHATQLVWFGRGGKQLGSLGPPGGYNEPWLSPDEKKVAVARPDPQTGRNDIWLLELARGISSRFTSDPSEDYTPLWSPDGSRIVFTSDREGHANVFQRPSSGAGNDELILKSNADKLLDDWSLDRRFIIYDTNPKGSIDLWVFPMLGDRKPFPFLQTEFNEGQGRFSPNGRWMAYASDETGRWEVYVRPFPASGDKWQVSTNGGADPSWRRDGNELFYIAVDRKLMAVDVKTDSTFHVGVPRALFEPRVSGLSPVEARNHYVVTADGQRFLINTLVEEGSSPITVVVNWLADLKRK